MPSWKSWVILMTGAKSRYRKSWQSSWATLKTGGNQATRRLEDGVPCQGNRSARTAAPQHAFMQKLQVKEHLQPSNANATEASFHRCSMSPALHGHGGSGPLLRGGRMRCPPSRTAGSGRTAPSASIRKFHQHVQTHKQHLATRTRKCTSAFCRKRLESVRSLKSAQQRSLLCSFESGTVHDNEEQDASY